MTTTTPVQRKTPGLHLGESITRFLEYFASICITLMMLHVLANVVGRTLFGEPVRGTNEWVGYIWLPLVALIGFVVSVIRGQTIDADLIYQRLPIRLRREVRFFTSLLSTIVCFGFAYYSYFEAIHAMKVGTNAPASDIYIAPIFLLVPVVFAVMAVLFLFDAIAAIRGKFDDEGFELTDPDGPDLIADLGRD